MKWLMRYKGEVMVSGTNARLRRLLGAPIVLAPRLKAQTLELPEDPEPQLLRLVREEREHQ